MRLVSSISWLKQKNNRIVNFSFWFTLLQLQGWTKCFEHSISWEADRHQLAYISPHFTEPKFPYVMITSSSLSKNVTAIIVKASQSMATRVPFPQIIIHHICLLYTSPHTPQIILISCIFIVIHNSFYYSTAKFTWNYMLLILWSDLDTF